MTNPPAGLSPQVYARTAGLLYLVIIVSGLFGEMIVRGSMILPGDATATAANILASEWLFRIGFASDAIMLLCDVGLAVLLYALLRPVSGTLSLAAAAFRLTQAAVLGMNLLNYYAALLLLTGTGYASVFPPDQLDALVMLFLDLHGHGYDLGLLFFGISTLLLGYLVYKSGYFPRMLGVLLALASLVYLAGSFTLFLSPPLASLISPMYILTIVAEISFCMWLLVKGVDIKVWNRRPGLA